MKKLVKSFVVLAAVGIAGAQVAWAEEDDGTPYAEIAKRIGPADPAFGLPLTANSYDYWIPKNVFGYLNAADVKAEAKGNPEINANSSCSSYHEKYAKDGLLDIRLALGYFDQSDGKNIEYANLDWGKSASFDEGTWIGIREVLMSPCERPERKLCGFAELTTADERRFDGKTVLTRKMTVHGRDVEVRVTLTYASASPFYERNKTVLRAKQERFTRTSEENFFGAVDTADYLFYIGHSRNGGGPDFNPPRVTKIGKTDYFGYYRKAYPGITRLTSLLKKTPNKDLTVGLFSCSSSQHFRGRLAAANKNQHMILTLGGEEVLDYYDVINVGMGYLEGLLRGSCSSQLDTFARVTDRERIAFQQYNVK